MQRRAAKQSLMPRPLRLKNVEESMNIWPVQDSLLTKQVQPDGDTVVDDTLDPHRLMESQASYELRKKL